MDDGGDEDLEYLERLDAFIENGQGGFTPRDELAKLGAAPPPLDGMDDDGVLRALTDLVWGLYDLGVIVEETDHLSDREIYALLLEFCDEITITSPHDPYSNLRWSPIGSRTQEGLMVYFRFYATDEEWNEFAEEFPEFQMPSRALPPHPRAWIPFAVPRTPRLDGVES